MQVTDGPVSRFDPARCPARQVAMTEQGIDLAVGRMLKRRGSLVEIALKIHVTVDAYSAAPLATQSVMEKLAQLDLCYAAWTAKDDAGDWLFPQHHTEGQRKQMFEHWGDTYGEIGFCRDGTVSTEPTMAAYPWIVACLKPGDANITWTDPAAPKVAGKAPPRQGPSDQGGAGLTVGASEVAKSKALPGAPSVKRRRFCRRLHRHHDRQGNA